MRSMTRRTSWLLAVAMMMLLCGCGQSIRVRVTRLGTLPSSPTHPAARARAEVRNLASELLVFLTLLEEATAARSGSIVASWVTKVTEIKATLADKLTDRAPLTVYETREKLQEIRGVVREMGPVEVLVQTAAADPEEEGKLLPKATDLFDRIQQAEFQAISAVAEAKDRLEYGGFRDNTVYRIDAASTAYETLAASPRGVLFSELRIDLTGDTAAMIVQQSPAYFTKKGVRADPTEVLRNSLIMVNKALRVTSRFIPQLSSASFAATPAGAAGAATPGGEEIDPEAVATDAAATALRELTIAPDIAPLLNKIKAGTPLSPEEETQLRGRLQAVLRLQDPDGS